MADGTIPTRHTSPFDDDDDVFRDLRADLEAEGHDLDGSMTHPTLEDKQLRRRVLFMPEKADDTNAEFLLDKEPYCLLASSSTFKITFFRELTHSTSPVDALKLEELTLLGYRMSILNLHQQLWTTYLQCGTGQLNNSSPSRQSEENMELHYWPTYLLSFAVGRALAKRMPRNCMDHEIRIASVQAYLVYLDDNIREYATRYERVKNEIPMYTSTWTDRIEECVRTRALSAVHIYFDVLIAFMKHDYMDRFLQRQYWQQKPMEEQVHKANRICRLILRTARAEQEFYLFREDAYVRKVPKLCSPIGANTPNTIRIVADPTMRASLLSQYVAIIDRAKYDLNTIMITAAATVKQDAQRELDGFVAEVWLDERREPESERLTTSMLQLIDQRQSNIIDCIRIIYAQKVQFFLRTPTVVGDRALFR